MDMTFYPLSAEKKGKKNEGRYETEQAQKQNYTNQIARDYYKSKSPSPYTGHPPLHPEKESKGMKKVQDIVRKESVDREYLQLPQTVSGSMNLSQQQMHQESTKKILSLINASKSGRIFNKSRNMDINDMMLT